MAIHYVSNIGAASWVDSTNILTPTDIYTAYDNAAAGDTVEFRGGTYNIISNDGSFYATLMPANSGASGSPIIFKAFTGETPTFNGTISGSTIWGTNGNVGAKVTGVVGQSYITFDGIKLTCDSGLYMSQLFIGDVNETLLGSDPYNPNNYSTHNIIVRNMNIDGGLVVSGGDNASAIRLEPCKDILIENNHLHDFTGTSNNASGITSYGGANVVTKNNKIKRTTCAMYIKSGNYNWDVYNNFIDDTGTGIFATGENYYASDIHIFNNIITNYSNLGIRADDEVQHGSNYYPSLENLRIYNNTLHPQSAGPNEGIFTRTSIARGGTQIYNNLVVGNHTQYGQMIADVDFTATIFDYNLQEQAYFNINSWGDQNYTSLAAAQAVTMMNLTTGNHNQNTISGSSISFTNGNGDFSAPSDFELDTGSDGENAGNDGEDMGANVALVGIGVEVDALLADNVESASEVSSPTVVDVPTGSHALTADDVESSSEVSSPVVGQSHVLLADDVESASEVSNPTAEDIPAGIHALFASDVESASVVSNPVLSVADEYKIDGVATLTITISYQSKTLYCSPENGYFTID